MEIFINGIGWVRLQEVQDEVYRQAFRPDCIDPTGIKLPEWYWFNLN